MNGITDLLLKAGPTRLFAALGIAAVVAALLFTLVFRMGGEEKARMESALYAQQFIARGGVYFSPVCSSSHWAS